ncbi:bifunctional protein-serine/threonine kinase/phosphatase [Prosthecobacter vanneervenii]|uniref:Serine/threonine protein phosphatase PrpC n=1 Tax=Prosthecobacter vanneervenii TaxID=48466 RepID=A0A7W8DJ00_9BACT|nr:bifunctional protein-serine/threonine kinase/phosphatase [Prosthecobacter vanneervenii]MBB5031639.1 serine/threonine protein phosphatase PrpC [Prosthecobacter vanneervenii]
MKILTTSHGIAREEGTPSSDAFALRAWDETVIAVLSDGAGSGAPAREAAQRAVSSLIEHYSARPRSWSPRQALTTFARILNQSLYQESQVRYERTEMVATLAAVVIEGDTLHGINLGDSAVYLWRNGGLHTLSTPHVEKERTNVLTRALGMQAEVEPACFTLTLQDGDVAMLCSDGVSNHISEHDLTTALSQHCSARSIVLAARQQAKDETLDDMSALVLDIQQTGRLRAMNARSLSIPATLNKGDVIDGYELIRSFHGTSRVWLAEKDGHRVVMKFAPVEAIDSAPHLEAFSHEVWNATRAQSSHFVRAYEPPALTTRCYLMEFVDAPSLAAVLRERVLSVDSAIALGKFLAEAAQVLLRLDLAHGDIKPENILCIGDYTRLTFKLVDLGSAAAIFSVSSRAGTASYLAPERFHEAPISERTEVFAIGVTLYQALAGRLPYGQIERFQTPVFHPARRLSRINPNIPSWLEAVIHRAIAIQPQRRYQHYSELLHDLCHPDRVQPFHEADTPLIERNPLVFYKIGFFILLLTTLCLAFKLLTLK